MLSHLIICNFIAIFLQRGNKEFPQERAKGLHARKAVEHQITTIFSGSCGCSKKRGPHFLKGAAGEQ